MTSKQQKRDVLGKFLPESETPPTVVISIGPVHGIMEQDGLTRYIMRTTVTMSEPDLADMLNGRELPFPRATATIEILRRDGKPWRDGLMAVVIGEGHASDRTASGARRFALVLAHCNATRRLQRLAIYQQAMCH